VHRPHRAARPDARPPSSRKCADAVRAQVQFSGMSAHPGHGLLQVVHLRGVRMLGRETIRRIHHRIATARQTLGNRVHVAAAILRSPAAAMNSARHTRPGPRACGWIDVCRDRLRPVFPACRWRPFQGEAGGVDGGDRRACAWANVRGAAGDEEQRRQEQEGFHEGGEGGSLHASGLDSSKPSWLALPCSFSHQINDRAEVGVEEAAVGAEGEGIGHVGHPVADETGAGDLASVASRVCSTSGGSRCSLLPVRSM